MPPATVARRLAQAWREGVTDAELHFGLYSAWRARLVSMGMPTLKGRRVLDIGCGDRAPVALLAAADGADVVAIDMLPIRLGWRRPRMWIDVARDSGIGAALRTVVRDAVHTRRYWRTLSRLAGRSLPSRDIELVQADAAALPFGDDAFDVVFSSAVWEHLPDVPAATREVNRVLRPDGIAIIQIALFPALQGGHQWEWHTIEAFAGRRSAPWSHLLPDHAPHPLYLNEWSEPQYRAVFDRELTILDWEDGPMRGESLLSDEIADRLARYSRRDLLLAWCTAWTRKRGPGSSR